jgi:aldehyde dehydrogenase (NAD+)
VLITHECPACTAGSRIFVQEGIYDEFLAKLTAIAKGIVLGDAFAPETIQGPQISQVHLDASVIIVITDISVVDPYCFFLQRILGYIDSGKKEGATLHTGGERHGTKGYFVTPAIFTEVKTDMKIYREEIFGPVAVIIKFKTDEGI